MHTHICTHTLIYILIHTHASTHAYTHTHIRGSFIREIFFKKAKYIFFRIFFHKRIFYKVWNWLIAKIISTSQIYFFWSYSKWWQIKQSAPGLNKSLSPIFCVVRSTNRVKFKEKCVMWMEKQILVLLTSKENVPGVTIRNADSLLEHEMTHYHWFPGKRHICKQFFQFPTT